MNVAYSKATIYVPVAGSRLDHELIPGSGVVGIERNGQLVLWYEGNLYGACNMHRIEDRIVCAFGRLATKYPTSAMRGLLDDERHDLIAVGEIRWPSAIMLTDEGCQLLKSYACRYEHAATEA